MTPAESFSQALEAIRRKEAEVKRRLASERDATEEVVAAAERRARERLNAAEMEGRRAGETQRQAARADAEREAGAILARAQADAQMLQDTGKRRMAAAVACAVEIVIGGAGET